MTAKIKSVKFETKQNVRRQNVRDMYLQKKHTFRRDPKII